MNVIFIPVKQLAYLVNPIAPLLPNIQGKISIKRGGVTRLRITGSARGIYGLCSMTPMWCQLVNQEIVI